jgi:hypothetical protein
MFSSRIYVAAVLLAICSRVALRAEELVIRVERVVVQTKDVVKPSDSGKIPDVDKFLDQRITEGKLKFRIAAGGRVLVGEKFEFVGREGVRMMTLSGDIREGGKGSYSVGVNVSSVDDPDNVHPGGQALMTSVALKVGEDLVLGELLSSTTTASNSKTSKWYLNPVAKLRLPIGAKKSETRNESDIFVLRLRRVTEE